MPTDYLIAEGPVGIRRVVPGDRDAFAAAVRASADLHGGWLALADSAEAFDAYVAACDRRTKEGLLICDRETGDLAGSVNLNTIVHGRFENAALGYGAFVPYAGKGFMSAGLALVIRFAFEQLNLHRLEANIQPGNEPSRRLVQRHGFRFEGLSPDYLFIDGAWRDHERWALITDNPQVPAAGRNDRR
ncbi:GNAT family N-acetyltransferase [Plantactinospora siamensis]|uniref:GNAT family N-acetyltransferase n=1 Tax=Plantactinospora siamensis TaxID=555372 RepID=A0ABV6NR32_9ACTN